MASRLLLLLTLLCAAWIPAGCARGEPVALGWPSSVASEPGLAFGAVRWGMSRAEIERVQHTALRAADPAFLSYYGPPGIERRRLADFEQHDLAIEGTRATVSYRLLDDRLYQVLIEQQGPPALKAQDGAIRAALQAAYGAGQAGDTQRSDQVQAHDWRLPTRQVRYWMLDDASEPDATRVFIGLEITDPSSPAASAP